MADGTWQSINMMTANMQTHTKKIGNMRSGSAIGDYSPNFSRTGSPIKGSLGGSDLKKLQFTTTASSAFPGQRRLNSELKGQSNEYLQVSPNNFSVANPSGGTSPTSSIQQA